MQHVGQGKNDQFGLFSVITGRRKRTLVAAAVLDPQSNRTIILTAGGSIELFQMHRVVLLIAVQAALILCTTPRCTVDAMDQLRCDWRELASGCLALLDSRLLFWVSAACVNILRCCWLCCSLTCCCMASCRDHPRCGQRAGRAESAVSTSEQTTTGKADLAAGFAVAVDRQVRCGAHSSMLATTRTALLRERAWQRAEQRCRSVCCGAAAERGEAARFGGRLFIWSGACTHGRRCVARSNGLRGDREAA